MRWLFPGLTALVALVFAAIAPPSGNTSATAPVYIGALLPLTGSLSSYGETSRAALLEAVDDINAMGERPIELVIEDTKTDPATAREKLALLRDMGIRIVIGPYASSEVIAAKPLADASGILLLSPLSTARSLAIPGDNVLRFTPDDEQEGKAVAALAYSDAVRVLIPLSRNDAGNLGLQSAVKVTFEKLGGQVLAPVLYGPTDGDFKEELAQVVATIKAQQAAGRHVGVYLTAFNEVTSLFRDAAAADPILKSVVWYGSDSVAQSKDLVEDKAAAAFAVTVDYPNPILGLSDGDKPIWGPVSNRVVARIGREPDAFALAAYDAIQLAYRVRAHVDGGTSVQELRRQIELAAADYVGLTGPAVLNAAGDRAIGNYDFWSVCPSGANYVWVRSAVYTVSTDGRGEPSNRPSC